MCLTIDTNIHPDHNVPIILSEDMKLYKILCSDNTSPCYALQYTSNTKYELDIGCFYSKMLTNKCTIWIVNAGFHALVNYEYAHKLRGTLIKQNPYKESYIVSDCITTGDFETLVGANV